MKRLKEEIHAGGLPVPRLDREISEDYNLVHNFHNNWDGVSTEN